MNVALFHNLPSGGAKRHTLEQVRELSRRGHRVQEFAPDTADLDFCSLAPYVERQSIFRTEPASVFARRVPFVTPYIHCAQGLQRLRRTDEVNKKIALAMDEGNFDVTLVKDCHIAMNPYVLRYLKMPSVFQCHHGLAYRVRPPSPAPRGKGPTPERLKALFYSPARLTFDRRFTYDGRRNIRAASRVLANSHFAAQLIERSYGVEPGLLYPGINTDLFEPRPVGKLDYVLCVGTLTFQKGHRFIISALAQISPARRPWLFIASNSKDSHEEQFVLELAAELGVDVHIETVLDGHRMAEIYSQAKVFVYAPMQEALGMAPLEAMACGTPVVAVGEGGVKETVVDGLTGWLVDREPGMFAEKLESLLSDDKSRFRMGQAGVDYVKRNWTWEQAVDRLEAELRERCA